MIFPHKIIESIDGIKIKSVGIRWLDDGTWIPEYKTVVSDE